MEAGRSTKAQAPFINWFAYQGKMEKVSSKQNLFLDTKFQFFGYIPFYRRGWTGNLPIFPYGHNKRALTIEHSDAIMSINWDIVGNHYNWESQVLIPPYARLVNSYYFKKRKKKPWHTRNFQQNIPFQIPCKVYHGSTPPYIPTLTQLDELTLRYNYITFRLSLSTTRSQPKPSKLETGNQELTVYHSIHARYLRNQLTDTKHQAVHEQIWMITRKPAIKKRNTIMTLVKNLFSVSYNLKLIYYSAIKYLAKDLL